jgi:hypothetical protein
MTALLARDCSPAIFRGSHENLLRLKRDYADCLANRSATVDSHGHSRVVDLRHGAFDQLTAIADREPNPTLNVRDPVQKARTAYPEVATEPEHGETLMLLGYPDTAGEQNGAENQQYGKKTIHARSRRTIEIKRRAAFDASAGSDCSA